MPNDVYVTGNIKTQAVCKLPDLIQAVCKLPEFPGSLQTAWNFRQFAKCLKFQSVCKLPRHYENYDSARQFANCLGILKTFEVPRWELRDAIWTREWCVSAFRPPACAADPTAGLPWLTPFYGIWHDCEHKDRYRHGVVCREWGRGSGLWQPFATAWWHSTLLETQYRISASLVPAHTLPSMLCCAARRSITFIVIWSRIKYVFYRKEYFNSQHSNF